MTLYWALLFLPALFAFHPVKFDENLRNIVFFIFGLCLVIIIGFRHEVGGDWFRYLDTAYGIKKGVDFDFSNFYTGDYAYRVIHWFSVNYLSGIYSTNLLSAIFFVAGLIRFSLNIPNSWISIFISIPFLVIIVSMGYTRQAAALGFIMWGLVDLMRGKNIRFYILVFIGSFFHITALIMTFVAVLYNNSSKYLFILLLFFIVLFMIGVYILFMEQIDHMIYYYITIKFHHSSGAIARVFMSFMAAIIFFAFYKKHKEIFNDTRLWYVFSLVNIILFPSAFYFSTFVDRIAIYFIPLQLVIFSRVPTLFAYFSLLFVWIFFGKHSRFWIPYQNLLTS